MTTDELADLLLGGGPLHESPCRHPACNPDEEGWAGSVLMEPLATVAGALLGMAVAAAVLWKLFWRYGVGRQ